MTFLEAINRILRINNIIAGDDDNLTSFNETQHYASLNLAQIAIQSESNTLTAENYIPYEEVDGTIDLVDGTRTYSLPSDFIRFKGRENVFLLEVDASEVSQNTWLTIIDEEKLRRTDLAYRSTSGNPYNFYLTGGIANKIGVYPVTNATKDGQKLLFPYEKAITLSVTTDVLPFRADLQSYLFLDMAARRLHYLYNELPLENMTEDRVWSAARAALINSITMINKSADRGTRYVR